MVVQHPILVEPCCPPSTDPEMRRLLELLAQVSGSDNVELDVLLDGARGHRQFSLDQRTNGGRTIELRSPGHFSARLMIDGSQLPDRALASLTLFALEKALLALSLIHI